ncbi:helix-turn-helix domain-containing protein, partial [Klebsiella pneumoniae]|nr:helix-turn-helix domain-containing protein [Klebsiella pneumoniae]
VCGKKIGPDPRNFNQRVSLGRNDLLIRTFPNYKVSKLIKDFTGKNFSDLLVEKRLDVLIHLLKHTNHSIIDVINMTGYENASHCYKVFKEKYNMSIKEYRDLNS